MNWDRFLLRFLLQRPCSTYLPRSSDWGPSHLLMGSSSGAAGLGNLTQGRTIAMQMRSLVVHVPWRNCIVADKKIVTRHPCWSPTPTSTRTGRIGFRLAAKTKSDGNLAICLTQWLDSWQPLSGKRYLHSALNSTSTRNGATLAPWWCDV